MAGILEGERVGVALTGFDEPSLRRGLQELIDLTRAPDIQARCVAAAERHFTLEEGARRYAAIYSQLDEVTQ